MAKPNHTNTDDWLDNEMIAHKKSLSSSLNGRFTEHVMEQIRQTEIDSLPSAEKRKRMVGLRWGAGMLGGLAIILLIYNLTNANVTRDTKRMSVAQTMPINKEIPWTDAGLQNAQSLGIIQMPGVSTTDQGYTLSLDEVIADDTRVVFSLLLTDSSGQTNQNWKDIFDQRMFHVRNEEGKEIAFYRSDIPLEDEGGEESQSPKNGKLWLTYAYNQIPGDHIIIESTVDRLYVTDDASTGLEGDWSFRYDVDMSKSKELSTAIEIDQSYTTPAGLSIMAQRLVRTPTGSLLQLETRLSDKAGERSPGELREDLTLLFHLENAQGEEIGRINSYGFTGFSVFELGHFKSEDSASRTQKWTFALPYLPYESTTMRLVLDGYSIPIQTDDSLTFNPADLKKQPAVFKGQGDVLYLHDFEIKENEADSGLSGRLLVSGEFVNSFQKDRWVAQDETGKTYDTQFTGHMQLGEIVTIEVPDAELHSASYLEIPGLATIPEKLTLIRTVTNKKYTDVDWSFNLPESGGVKD